MTIYDIENKSFDELKAGKDDYVAEARAMPLKEVAERYIQALTDAKHRDETLAEQAKTLQALQQGMDAVTERSEAAAIEAGEQLKALKEESVDRLASAQIKLEKCLGERGNLQSEVRQTHETITRLQDTLHTETARADRLKTEALANHAAITTAAKALNDAQARQAVEKASEGK